MPAPTRTPSEHAATEADPDAVEVAVLDGDGVIVWVNRCWDEFCRAAGGDTARCGAGVSYLGVCDAQRDPASAALAGSLRSALRGDAVLARRHLVLCSGPAGPQWFDVHVTTRLDERGTAVGATVALVPLPFPLAPGSDGLPGSAGTGGPLLQVAELVASERSLRDLAERVTRAAVELTGCRWASVRLEPDAHGAGGSVRTRAGGPGPPGGAERAYPLVADGAPAGEIVVSDPDPETLSPAADAVLARLAAVTGTALTNTRLYQAAERQRQWLADAARLSERMLADHADDPLETVLDHVEHAVHADVVAVLVDDGGRPRVRGITGHAADRLRSSGLVTGALLGRVLRTRAPADRSEVAAAAAAAGLCARGVVPVLLRVAGHSALCAARLPGASAFTDAQRADLAGYAHFVGLALDLDRGRAAERDLTLARERERIAVALAEGIGMDVFDAGMALASVLERIEDEEARERVAACITTLDTVLSQTRNTVLEPRS